MTVLRLAFAFAAAVLAAATAQAEFLRVEVKFQGTDCISCTESLQGRLERVRGVESVALDLDQSIVTMQLEAGNKVRLAPLLSRITQDGTKISRTNVVVTGTIVEQNDGMHFQPEGLRETYRLQLPSADANRKLQTESRYKIEGTVSEVEPGTEPAIEAHSVEPIQ